MDLKVAETDDEVEFQKKRDEASALSHQPHPQLKKPTPYSGRVPEPKVGKGPLEVFGYGNMRKEYPLELMSFQRRPTRSSDVVIQILYCGICHSDWHVIRDDWKNSKYPIVTGHEIVGTVLEIGKEVTKFKIGDTVALGPNYDSCRQCDQCNSGFEQYCENGVTETYNMSERLPGEIKATGPVTQGGYSTAIVADEHYVFRVPEGADLDRVPPLLCAGATMYTPLKYCGLPAGSRIGIAGMGGLGNIGAKLAKSMGYELIALTTTPEKISDYSTLADQALLATNLTLMDAYRLSFDMIICTIPFPHDVNMYINYLKPQGIMWIVGVMMDMSIDFDSLNRKGRIIRGSSTAGMADTQECINYCVENDVYPDVEFIGVGQLNASHEHIVNKLARYRYVVDMRTIY